MHPLLHSTLYTIPTLPILVIRRYLSPRDKRWQGSQHFGLVLLLLITLLILALWILFGVSLSISKKIDDAYNTALEAQLRTGIYNNNSNFPDYPPIIWGGEYYNAAGEIFMRAYALMLDTIHLSIAHLLLWTSRLHPVFALVSSLFAALAWLAAALVSLCMQMSDENPPEETDGLLYQRLVTAMYSLEFLVAILHFTYIGFAAVAVHRWRAAKREYKNMDWRGLSDRTGRAWNERV